MFNFGNNTGEFFLDDISLKSLESSAVRANSESPGTMILGNAYPNPFNSHTRIPCHVNRTVKIMLSLWNIRGEKVSELMNRVAEPGDYQIDLNADDLCTGIYLIRLEGRLNGKQFSQSQKLMLVR